MRILHFGRLITAMLCGVGLLFIVVGTAFAHTAHAKVLTATPAIGSTIASVPNKITVECAENINPDPKLSNLFVYAPNGDLISSGNATIPLSSPKEMSITIKPSGNGIYIVRWITVSAEDGDPDQGAFVFTVKASTTTTTPVGNSTPSATTSGTNGIPLWVPIIVGILALVVGLGGGMALGTSRAKHPTISTMRQAVRAQEKEETPPSRPHTGR